MRGRWVTVNSKMVLLCSCAEEASRRRRWSAQKTACNFTWRLEPRLTAWHVGICGQPVFDMGQQEPHWGLQQRTAASSTPWQAERGGRGPCEQNCRRVRRVSQPYDCARRLSAGMQTFTAVLLLAACVAASASNLSTGRKLSEDAQSETVRFSARTAPRATGCARLLLSVHTLRGTAAWLRRCALPFHPWLLDGNQAARLRAQFFGFGTAPKPTLGQIHQSIFGFNADGSPAMAPAPAMNKGAHDETVRVPCLTCSVGLPPAGAAQRRFSARRSPREEDHMCYQHSADDRRPELLCWAASAAMYGGLCATARHSPAEVSTASLRG